MAAAARRFEAAGGALPFPGRGAVGQTGLSALATVGRGFCGTVATGPGFVVLGAGRGGSCRLARLADTGDRSAAGAAPEANAGAGFSVPDACAARGAGTAARSLFLGG